MGDRGDFDRIDNGREQSTLKAEKIPFEKFVATGHQTELLPMSSSDRLET